MVIIKNITTNFLSGRSLFDFGVCIVLRAHSMNLDNSAFSESVPITTRSGRIKSFKAEPSRKNSGLATTSNFSGEIFSDIIDLIFLVVPTGTVDLTSGEFKPTN